MSFSKVGPGGGWSVGAKLTSAQMNQLDADHANALDKSVAGDQLIGAVTLASTASITVGISGGVIAVATAAGLSANVASAVQANHFASIVTPVAGGICATVAGGIVPTTQGGISDGGVAGGISTTTAGGIYLDGGSNDWIQYVGGRSFSEYVPLSLQPLNTGWLAGPEGDPGQIIGPGTSVVQGVSLWSRSGWTLSSVNLQIVVTNAHSGGAPATFPGIDVRRVTVPSVGGSGSLTSVSLNSGGAQYFFASSGSGWYDGELVQQLSFTCNQNNFVNRSAYRYTIYLSDESGANAESGNVFLGCMLNWTFGQSSPW